MATTIEDLPCTICSSMLVRSGVGVVSHAMCPHAVLCCGASQCDQQNSPAGAAHAFQEALRLNPHDRVLKQVSGPAATGAAGQGLLA